MDTTTMQHQGDMPGGARLVAAGRSVVIEVPSRTWRGQGFDGCGTTGLGNFATNAYAATTNPADGTGLPSVKPPARHLAVRST